MRATPFIGIHRQFGGWHGGKQWRRSHRLGAPVTGPAGRNKASER